MNEPARAQASAHRAAKKDRGSRTRAMLLVAATIVFCTGPRAQEAPAHGDHNPHHGGLVLMYGMDLHYEVLLLPAGGVQLWLTDAVRKDLPASIVSDVAVEIERPSGVMETVNMTISDSGECWQGRSKPVKEAKASIHLAFVYQGQAAVLSLPAEALLNAGKGAVAAGREAGRDAH